MARNVAGKLSDITLSSFLFYVDSRVHSVMAFHLQYTRNKRSFKMCLLAIPRVFPKSGAVQSGRHLSQYFFRNMLTHYVEPTRYAENLSSL